jgi:hypothetical protein
MKDDELTDAVVEWTGWGAHAWPARDDLRILNEFGQARGAVLVEAVHRLAGDFYESSARFTVSDLAQMSDQAADEFRERHPEVGEQAVRALAWCYTFDFK